MSLKEDLNGYLRLPRNFFGIPEPTNGEPDIGILGIPYDITSSYQSGSRMGPDYIRAATDSERSHSYPLSIGHPHFTYQKPLSKQITLEDIGDLEVGVQHPESASVHMLEAAKKLGSHKTNLLFLGGDHFITYPLLKGLHGSNSEKVGLVYLDAHADLYSDMGGQSLSHATTLRRIIDDKIVKIENIVAHDLRMALPQHRMELAGKDEVTIHDLKSFTHTVTEMSERVDWIYVSVDLDVLRPEIAPGVSHPESGGLDMFDLVNLLRVCFISLKVRYADIVELNPHMDRSNLTSIAARDVVKEILTGFAYQKSFK